MRSRGDEGGGGKRGRERADRVGRECVAELRQKEFIVLFACKSHTPRLNSSKLICETPALLPSCSRRLA